MPAAGGGGDRPRARHVVVVVWVPTTGRRAGDREGLGTDEQLGGELDEFEPDHVLGELVQHVAQLAVLQLVDVVLGAGAGAGACPVPELEPADPPADRVDL